MFVLCPHCHFLVGIDPRTGKAPLACPKCGGAVVEPSLEGHVEVGPALPLPLDPFAAAALPSVAATLPPLPAEAGRPESTEAETIAPGPVELHPAAPDPVAPDPVAPDPVAPEPVAPDPTLKPASPKPASPKPTRPKPAPPPPAAPAPAPPEPAIPVAEAAPAAAIPAATASVPKRSFWPRRKAAVPATEPAAAPAAAAEDTPPPQAPRADGVRQAAPRRRRSINVVEAPPAEVAVPMTMAEQGHALPPIVVTEETTSPAAVGGRGEASLATPAMPASDAIADVALAGTAEPAHPMRRRTDLDPNAAIEPVDGVVPAHPLRRRTDVAAPSFTRAPARAHPSRIGWRSISVVGGLSLLLALQLLLAQRDTLATSPRWRPMIAALCSALRCTLPPWREPAAFAMLSRDVRPHPTAPGTLLVNASFRNNARWPQPWPSLLLTLSDLDGRMVGARSFTVGEYLGAAPAQAELAPGQSAAVSLVVVEPAPNVVAFTFDFR